MKNANYFRRLPQLAAVVLVATATSAPLAIAADRAKTDVPDTNYVCEVQTESGVAGLVFAQAQDLDTAKQMVQDAPARTLSGGVSTAKTIVQCITPGKQKFRDGTIQKFYDQYPR
ncbi:MAG: hypothetical protein Hals2KO_29780 [Halioglobus sp.]